MISLSDVKNGLYRSSYVHIFLITWLDVMCIAYQQCTVKWICFYFMEFFFFSSLFCPRLSTYDFIMFYSTNIQIPDNSRFLVGQYVTIHDDVISHVNITNVKEEDGGEYMCTAQNIIGKYVCNTIQKLFHISIVFI